MKKGPGLYFYLLMAIVWPLILTYGTHYAEGYITQHAAGAVDSLYKNLLPAFFILIGILFAYVGNAEREHPLSVMTFAGTASFIIAILGYAAHSMVSDGSGFITGNLAAFIRENFDGNNAFIAIGFSAYIALREIKETIIISMRRRKDS